MAEKADLRMLARKVSHDQFELACDDLSRGLEHAIGKLNVQEALWQQALDDIQREIEMKLDKMELSPMKDFFNSKLKQLQDNLKQMAAMRLEVEAAGTKRRLL
ncbi:jg26469, partial [Pararge aegeria aegeria]